jgi:titin
MAAVVAACGEDRVIEPTEPTELTVQAVGAPAVPDQYIIIFRDDAPRPGTIARQLADAHGLGLRHTYEHTIKGFSAIVPPGRLDALRRHPLVRSIEPNTVMQLHPVFLAAADLPPKPPSRPRFLVARVLDWQRIDLTWQDRSSDEDGFEIQRRGADGGYTTIAITAANVTSFSDAGLDPSTTYTYQIRAFNATGESRWTKESSATTTPPPPVGPAALTATAIDHQRIDLTWTDNSSDETGFRIERKLEPDGSFTLITTVGANVTRYYNSNLEGGTTYTYRIRAFNAGGDSPYSNEATATTETATAPAVPADLVATAIDHQRIDLTWTDNSSDETGFRIERKLEPDGSFALITTVGANVTKYYNSNLEGGTTYTYRIRAFNAVGDSPYSNEATATTETATLPAVPADLVATAIDHQRVDLTWTDNSSDETGFRIERKQELSGTFALIATVGANVTKYYNTGLEDGTTYTYRVQSFNPVGDSEYSNEASAATPLATTPSAPSSLLATAVSGDRIDLTWTDNSSDETGFRIERKHEPLGSFALIATVGANVTKYYNTGLEPGTTYTYRIRAYNAVGDSENSNEATAMTGLPPMPPGDLAATAIDHQRIDLTWTDNSGDETGFRIERKLEPDGSFALITTVGANVTKYYNTGLQAGTTYTYRVRSFNAGGNSPASNEATATTDAAVLPAAPSDLNASAADHQRIDLTWTDNSSDETGFRIERKLEPDGSFALITTVGANVTKYYNSNLESGTTYTYRIRAFNAVGNSPYSNEATATTDAAVLPAAPDNLAATAVGQNRIDLTWTDHADDETGFRIERKREPDGSFALITTVGANVTRLYDTGLQAGTGYTYRLRAFNEIGESENSNEAMATTEPEPAPPAAPGSLAANAADHQRINLTWSDNSSDEDGFTIQRKLGPSGSVDPFVDVMTAASNATDFGDTGLEAETDYCYRVFAFNTLGESDVSNVACATTAVAPPPPPPGSCVDTGNHDLPSGSFDLWNIAKIEANLNPTWQATQQVGCEIAVEFYGLDSGVDSDHPDLNVIEVRNFVASEPSASGEDGNGHGTHTAGTAAAIDGNGGVVGVAPGAPVYGFRICSDDGNCAVDDIIAGIDEVTARKTAVPDRLMVANMSLGGDPSPALDTAVRRSINAGVIYSISAGNGLLGFCLVPNDAQSHSPARVGDDDISAADGSNGDARPVNGAITVTSSDRNDQDVNCNYGNPVTVAAPGEGITSTWLNGGYSTISGTSMAAPHVAGAVMLYLQTHPEAAPAQVEQAILDLLEAWTTNDLPNADGRLNVGGL